MVVAVDAAVPSRCFFSDALITRRVLLKHFYLVTHAEENGHLACILS